MEDRPAGRVGVGPRARPGARTGQDRSVRQDHDLVEKRRSGLSIKVTMAIARISSGVDQMSFLTKLPRERYSASAFDRFTGGREFDLGTAKALAWMSQLAYETDEPGK